MRLTECFTADAVPEQLRRAAKAAFAVGAKVSVTADQERLMVQFKDSDSYQFDPEYISLHALELVGCARTFGFVQWSHAGWVRLPLVVRTVFSAEDVRVQIGGSRWYVADIPNTAHALRRAILNAFVDYYDQSIAPYTQT